MCVRVAGRIHTQSRNGVGTPVARLAVRPPAAGRSAPDLLGEEPVGLLRRSAATPSELASAFMELLTELAQMPG